MEYPLATCKHCTYRQSCCSSSYLCTIRIIFYGVNCRQRLRITIATTFVVTQLITRRETANFSFFLASPCSSTSAFARTGSGSGGINRKESFACDGRTQPSTARFLWFAGRRAQFESSRHRKPSKCSPTAAPPHLPIKYIISHGQYLQSSAEWTKCHLTSFCVFSVC